ncbi:resolvase [Clostridia bacterium]|nr:resolvase [Clostridia bacterium]
MSRFGRNYLESGLYFEEISQLMNIRFISLSENLDTIDPKCPAIKMLPLYNLFNEWHSQTTSEKIRATMAAMAKEGKCIATFAPYGYQKSTDNHHKLVVDETAAVVVRRIFEMRAKGVSAYAIAKTLNSESIDSPSDYSEKYRGIEPKTKHYWQNTVIVSITKNPVYIGSIASQKTSSQSFKNRKRKTNLVDDWVIVPNMHEPIISEKLWQTVQEVNDKNVRVRSTKDSAVNPFSSLLQCKGCGCQMTRNRSKHTLKNGSINYSSSFSCSLNMRTGVFACSPHRINEKDLNEIILADITNKANFVLENRENAKSIFLKKKMKDGKIKLNAEKELYRQTEKRLAELDKLITTVYEDKLIGKIPEKLCISQLEKYQKEQEKLKTKADLLKTKLERISKDENDIENFLDLITKYANATEVTREMTSELIDKIIIGERDKDKPREIEISYMHLDC